MKKIILAITLSILLILPLSAAAMTEVERQNLIISLLQRIMELQMQLNEMLAKQIPAGGGEISDTIAPKVDLSKWAITTTGSFMEHDWCKNKGIPCGILGVHADYSDAQPSSGIDKIEYFVDGKKVGVSSNGNKVAWDTRNFDNGERVLSAKACDKAGNCGENSIKIKIQN